MINICKNYCMYKPTCSLLNHKYVFCFLWAEIPHQKWFLFNGVCLASQITGTTCIDKWTVLNSLVVQGMWFNPSSLFKSSCMLYPIVSVHWLLSHYAFGKETENDLFGIIVVNKFLMLSAFRKIHSLQRLMNYW